MTSRAVLAWQWAGGRLRATTPDDALRALPSSLAFAAGIALVIIGLQVLTQGPFPTLLIPRLVVFKWTAMVAVAAAVLAAWLRVARPPRLLNVMPDAAHGLTAFLVGINGGVVLLFVPLSLLVWRFDADLMSGWTYPFFNKRWLAAMFFVGVAAVLLLPHAVAQVIGMPAAVSVTDVNDRGRRSWLGHLAGIAALALAVWYFVGPPWNIAQHHRPIDFHEQVHLGPLQAIDKGYLPFVGPASTQYGAGSQMLTYGLMKVSGRFDVVSFRNAQAWLHLGATILAVLVSYGLAGFWRTLAMLAIALTYSPLRFLFPAPDGTLTGAFGWGNAWRYLGALVVVPAVALAARRLRDDSRMAPVALAAGVVWGLFSWIAQENFLSTGVASSMILVLLGLTGTSSWRTAIVTFAGLCAGCAAAWALVLSWYTWHGAAAEYLSNYFVVASAVATGLQNTWWTGDPGLSRAFWLTAPFLLAVGVCVSWDLRTLRPRQQLAEPQVILLALVCVALPCYHTVLYRSDGAHLTNTAIAMPLVIVLALIDLPRWTLGEARLRWVARAAGLAVVLWLFPLGALLTSPVDSLLGPPMARFRLPAAAAAVDLRVPFQRATVALADEPAVNTGGPAMGTFLEFAGDLRELIGTRRVYVTDSLFAYSSLFYFIADLTPAPFMGDPEIMLIHNQRRAAALAHMRKNIDRFDCIVTPRIDTPEARLFLAASPAARVIERELAGRSVLVILADEPGRPFLEPRS